MIVTTGLRAASGRTDLAAQFSRELGCPLIARGGSSLAALQSTHGADAVVVVGGQRVSLLYKGREFFFHPGMAKVRIRALSAGKTDQMVKAMDLRPGDRVLDCTLGLGADAIVASFAVGPRGVVTGVEVSPLLCAVVGHGLKTYRGKDDSSFFIAALRRIKVRCDDHMRVLAETPDGAYDVVYFDPMFRRPVSRSSAMEPLRPLAGGEPLSLAALAEARRVAARRVVIKERRGSQEFDRLGLERIEGGRYAPVAYGILARGRKTADGRG